MAEWRHSPVTRRPVAEGGVATRATALLVAMFHPVRQQSESLVLVLVLNLSSFLGDNFDLENELSPSHF